MVMSGSYSYKYFAGECRSIMPLSWLMGSPGKAGLSGWTAVDALVDSCAGMDVFDLPLKAAWEQLEFIIGKHGFRQIHLYIILESTEFSV
jgi:hypothetical protein